MKNRWFLIVVGAALAAAACSGSNALLPPPTVPSAQATAEPASVPIGSRPPPAMLNRDRVRRLAIYNRSTFLIRINGSSFKFPPFGGFTGTGFYTKNNAPAGATLQITNSGTNNLLGIPLSATGQVVLYFEAQLGGGAYSVKFLKSARTMTLASTQLQATASYTVQVYLWNQLIESYSAGSPVNGTLTFQTPLSNLTLSYYTPICIELIQTGGATPTPSPTPTPYPQTMYVAYNDPTNGGVYSFDGDNFGSAPSNFAALPSAFAAAVDDSQNLYVTATSPATLNEYYPGGVSFTYTSGMASPTGVAINTGANAPIVVANGAGISGVGQLLTFQQGVNQASPSSDPNLVSIASVALDADGNIYVGGTSVLNTPEVDLETKGSIANLGLHLISTPTGLTLDESGDLLVAQSAGVAVFAPGQTAPTKWIGSYGQAAYAVAFGDGGNWLYVVYDTPLCYVSCVTVFAYPGGSMLGQYNLSGTAAYYGVALSPRVPLFKPTAMRRKHPHWQYWTNYVGKAVIRRARS